VAEEATLRRVTAAFFAQHPISELNGHTEHWLGQQGRLTEPMVRRRGSSSWVREPPATPLLRLCAARATAASWY